MGVSSIDTIVGRRLRLLRLLQNVAVDEFAALFGMSGDYVAACELSNTRFAPTHIAMVAEHFRLPISWFFFSFEDPSFEDAMLQHVEKAAQSRRPQDIQFLSRISKIVTAMPTAKFRDRNRFVEEARVLMRERSCA